MCIVCELVYGACPHSGNLLLRHLGWDAPDEQGGGKVERTGLGWSLLLSLIVTLYTHIHTLRSL